MTHPLAEPSDAITLDDVETFTEGECDVLAFELARRTGWSVVVVADGPHGVVGWVHAAVRTPNGCILDIEGLWEPADWRDRWAGDIDAISHDREGYDSDLVSVHDGRDAGLTDISPVAWVRDRAATVADVLLRELVPGAFAQVA